MCNCTYNQITSHSDCQRGQSLYFRDGTGYNARFVRCQNYCLKTAKMRQEHFSCKKTPFVCLKQSKVCTINEKNSCFRAVILSFTLNFAIDQQVHFVTLHNLKTRSLYCISHLSVKVSLTLQFSNQNGCRNLFRFTAHDIPPA